jgi:hypothetical protein
MDLDITRRSTLLGMAGGIMLTGSGHAQQGPSPVAGPASTILINNVQIFDGVADRLRPGHLLAEESKIRQISSDPIAAPAGAMVTKEAVACSCPDCPTPTGTLQWPPTQWRTCSQPTPGRRRTEPSCYGGRAQLFGACLGVDPIAFRKGSQARLTILYCSTDRLCRGGASMENLAHSASLHSGENDAPSKPGTKHLSWDELQAAR